jgi:hypothetical protein
VEEVSIFKGMSEKLGKYFLILFGLILMPLTGCGTVSTYGYVERFEMDMSPAPELRGAGQYLKDDSSSVRLSAHVNMGPSGWDTRSSLKNNPESCRGLVTCDGYDTLYIDRYVTGEYDIAYPYVTASLDYVHKFNLFMIGVSGGLDKGAFVDAMLGFNTSYFEIGAVFGMWVYARGFKYSGTEFECKKGFFTDDELNQAPFWDSNGSGFSFFYGGFVTAFVGAFSLNASFDIYRPDPSFSDNDDIVAEFEFPLVQTWYATAGYRINRNWELRLGAVNVTSKFPDMHLSFNGGFSYYL